MINFYRINKTYYTNFIINWKILRMTTFLIIENKIKKGK